MREVSFADCTARTTALAPSVVMGFCPICNVVTFNILYVLPIIDFHKLILQS